MPDTLTVYWANISVTGTCLNTNFEDPVSLINELSLNKNKNNPDDNFLRCPAITDLGKNLFILKNTIKTSASFVIENEKISGKIDSIDGRWFVNRPPSLNNQSLAAYDYAIIFFAEEDVDVMVTSPYFSETPHQSWGKIVPGVYNCGSWFRPINMEFNVWEGVTDISLEEGEHLAYAKFFTEKTVVLKRFAMTKDLVNQARNCSAAGSWEPRVPLLKRYKRFKNSKRDLLILNKIRQNLI